MLQPLLKQIAEPLVAHVADDLLARFSRPDGLRGLYGRGRQNAEKYVLFHPESPLWTGERKQRLTQMAERARDDAAVHANFVEFIGMLEYGVTNGIHPSSPQQVLDLAKNQEIVGLAWRAATARRLQPRALGSLRDDRETLARIAGTEEHLPLPVWWSEMLGMDSHQADPSAETVGSDSRQ